MGASLNTGNAGGGSRRGRRRGRKAPMSEINVTPMVDVMLVLLIIFMVAAPLLQVGIPVDVPGVSGKALEVKKKQTHITIKSNGEIYIEEAQVQLADLATKLKAMEGNGNPEETSLIVSCDKAAAFDVAIKVINALSTSGFKKLSFRTEDKG